MHLTSDQVAAAEFAGVQFLPATVDQVHRLTMHRKVFRIGEVAVLATRDGSLFETAATLGPLIRQGEQQRRDLAGWQEAEASVPRSPLEPSLAMDNHAEAIRADQVPSKSEQLGIDIAALPPLVPEETVREPTPKRRVAPKYRGPNGEEWAGRGRTPRWVLAIEAEGKSRDDFLIGKSAVD